MLGWLVTKQTDSWLLSNQMDALAHLCARSFTFVHDHHYYIQSGDIMEMLICCIFSFVMIVVIIWPLFLLTNVYSLRDVEVV